MGMAVFNGSQPNVRVIRLEGEVLNKARAFSDTINESHDELRRAKAAYLEAIADINARYGVLLRNQWEAIAKLHGLDPVETWESQNAMLDCDYINDGIAYLRITEEEQPKDERALRMLSDAKPSPGSRLN